MQPRRHSPADMECFFLSRKCGEIGVAHLRTASSRVTIYRLPMMEVAYDVIDERVVVEWTVAVELVPLSTELILLQLTKWNYITSDTMQSRDYNLSTLYNLETRDR